METENEVMEKLMKIDANTFYFFFLELSLPRRVLSSSQSAEGSLLNKISQL